MQYVHYAGNPFDFNSYNEKTGFHRITDKLSYKNAPNGMSLDYANIEVIRGAESDTLAMVIYPYNSSTVWYRSSNNANWASATWNQFATKSDLSALWPVNAGTEIVAGTDMKTITAPGYYYCVNNNTAGSLKNCPLTEAFTLVVYRAAGGMGNNTFYIAQEYTSYICNKRIIQTYNKDSGNWTTHEIQFKS